MNSRIPVTLITGFLGSGKTTLLNKLLPHPKMKDTAVIINEIGDAGLDDIFANSKIAANVESEHVADDNMVMLDSGCLCCSLKNELGDTMRDLYFKRSLQAIPEFQRLIIETTGLADPGPILANLMNEPVIESVYQLDAVIVLVDAAHGSEQIVSQREALKQVAVADALLISKSDCVSPSDLESLQATLTTINATAKQVLALHGEVDPSEIIEVGLFDAEQKHAMPLRWLGEKPKTKGLLKKQNHHHEVQTFTVYLPSPITWKTVKPILLKLCQQHGKGLLRLKGILHCEDTPHPLAVHAVHFTPYPATPLLDWTEDQPQNRIVIIGKDLDEEAIRVLLTQL